MSKVFDINTLKNCASCGVGLKGEVMFDAVLAALKAAYPGVIRIKERVWSPNYAGGCKWNMCFLYASWTEYLIFVGSSVGTHGFSGRFHADIKDFIFSGEVRVNAEGKTERDIFQAGDMIELNAKDTSLIHIPDSAWMIEYAHGFIPSMIPFGLIETFTSSLDWRVFYRTSKAYLKHALGKC